MKILLFTCIFFIFVYACAAPILYSGMSDRKVNHLFREIVKGKANYKIKYNPDSTYALCILNDNSELAAVPLTFFILDIQSGKKVLISIKEYQRISWIDKENLLFSNYKDAPNLDRIPNKKPDSNYQEFIFNVTSKQTQLRKLKIEK
jgi:hypothetical protein